MEMLQMWIAVLSSCVLLAGVVDGYSAGAPVATCESMQPGHGFTNQAAPSPYTVTFSSSTYGPGSEMTVSITGDQSFKGFHCQVRDENSNQVGTFALISPPQYNTLDCNGDATAVTHMNSNDKDEESFPWMAPSSDVGTLTARCTIVQQFTTYWVGVESAMGISFRDDGMNTPPTRDPPSSPSTTERPVQSGSTEEDDDEDVNVGVIVGVVVGAAALLSLLALLGLWFGRR